MPFQSNIAHRQYRLSALQTLTLVCGRFAKPPEPSGEPIGILVHRSLQLRCIEHKGLQPDKIGIGLLQIHGNFAHRWHRLSALQTLTLLCGRVANPPEPSGEPRGILVHRSLQLRCIEHKGFQPDKSGANLCHSTPSWFIGVCNSDA